MGPVSGFKKEQFKREKDFQFDRANLRFSYIILQAISMFRKHFNNLHILNDIHKLNKILDIYENLYPPQYNMNISKKTYCSLSTWRNLEENHKHVNLVKMDCTEILSKNILKRINTSKKIISITLKESTYLLNRNSLSDEWKKFILYLEKNNYFVIVIRDSESFLVTDRFSSHDIIPSAAYDLYLKASIYKISFLNYFVSGGPRAICWINNYKSVGFKNWGIVEDRNLHENNFGIEKSQKSKVLDNSRHFLLQDADTFSNLVKFHEKNYY